MILALSMILLHGLDLTWNQYNLLKLVIRVIGEISNEHENILKRETKKID